MFSAKYFSAVLASICLLQQTSALGINCRGSGVCPLAGFENDGDEGVLQGLRDAMYSVDAATVPGSTTYHDGDHIICVSSSIKISISAGVSAKGVSAKVGLNGKLGIGGVCAFAQDTGGAGITLDRARQLMDGLLEHGCKVCGSNPTQPGNNVKNGQLTINYVKNPSCTGNCLGAGAGLNPTAGKDQTSSQAAEPASSAASAVPSSSSSVVASATSSVPVGTSDKSTATPSSQASVSGAASSSVKNPVAVSQSSGLIGPSSSLASFGNATTFSTQTKAAPATGTPKPQGGQSYTTIPYIAWSTVLL